MTGFDHIYNETSLVGLPASEVIRMSVEVLCWPLHVTPGKKPPAEGVDSNGVRPAVPSISPSREMPLDGVWIGIKESPDDGRLVVADPKDANGSEFGRRVTFRLEDCWTFCNLQPPESLWLLRSVSILSLNSCSLFKSLRSWIWSRSRFSVSFVSSVVWSILRFRHRAAACLFLSRLTCLLTCSSVDN